MVSEEPTAAWENESLPPFDRVEAAEKAYQDQLIPWETVEKVMELLSEEDWEKLDAREGYEGVDELLMVAAKSRHSPKGQN